MGRVEALPLPVSLLGLITSGYIPFRLGLVSNSCFGEQRTPKKPFQVVLEINPLVKRHPFSPFIPLPALPQTRLTRLEYDVMCLTIPGVW